MKRIYLGSTPQSANTHVLEWLKTMPDIKWVAVASHQPNRNKWSKVTNVTKVCAPAEVSDFPDYIICDHVLAHTFYEGAGWPTVKGCVVIASKAPVGLAPTFFDGVFFTKTVKQATVDLYAYWLNKEKSENIAYIKSDDQPIYEWKKSESKMIATSTVSSQILCETRMESSDDIKTDHVRRWLTIQSDKMENVTSAFQTQLREPIWKPILSKVMFGKGKDESYLTYCFHLDKSSEDLFVLWVLRVLRDFKHQGLIRSGGWII